MDTIPENHINDGHVAHHGRGNADVKKGVSLFSNVVKIKRTEKGFAQNKLLLITEYSAHPIYILIGSIFNIRKMEPATRSGGDLKKGGEKFI